MFPNMSEVLWIVFSVHALEACLVNLMPQKLLIFSDALGERKSTRNCYISQNVRTFEIDFHWRVYGYAG